MEAISCKGDKTGGRENCYFPRASKSKSNNVSILHIFTRLMKGKKKLTSTARGIKNHP